MLQTIREKAQGVVAWFIVILISIPFALFGISSYFGGGDEPVVAVVNDTDITESDFENRYRDFRQNLRQRLGAEYRPELLDDKTMRNEVLESMILNSLLMQRADELGLRAGNDSIRSAIRSIPSFQVDGRFNQTAYERAIRSQGLTPPGFEEQMRNGLVSRQLTNAIKDSEFSTKRELEELVRLRLQRREFEYVLLTVTPLLDTIEVDEPAVRAHYDANGADYMSPERIKVEYLDLDANTIAKTLQAEEQDLLDYYEQHKEEFLAPAQRRASHILILAEEGSSEDSVKEAKAKADDIYQRLMAGEAFDALAKSLSDDPGSAEQGGDLGYFETGIMDESFDAAVLALKEGEISQPVRSSFGFHVIKLTGIREAEGKAFSDVKNEVKQLYLKSKADDLFYDYAERLSNQAYEYPDSLEPAADDLGMPLKVSGWVTRNSGEGVLANPKVLAAAYSDEVLAEGQNSDTIEITNEHVMVLRLVEHEVATLKPYEDVKQLIIDKLKKIKAAELVLSKGEALVKRLRGGAVLASAAESSGFSLQQKQEVGRDDDKVPAAVIQKLYSIPRPMAGSMNYDLVQLANGDVAVISLSKVIDGKMVDVLKIGSEAAIGNALQRARGDSYFDHMQKNLLDNADVVRSLSNSEG